MSDHTFSLFHQVAPPKSGLGGKPPLLLLLHGYGANEDDLFSLAPYLDERFLIVSAQAPIMLQPMSYAWFNLGFTPQGIVVNPEEVESSRLTIHKFLGEIVEAYDCDPKAVYLMGFSQGAMMSLAVALTYPGSAAGVVAMSGRALPQALQLVADKDTLSGLPIFVAHGSRDMLIPINQGRDTRAKLSELPVDLTYREYDMGHEISYDSLKDIAEWLKERLNHAQIARI
ncbi:MAG TPA: dienelactone hydrolase family protein [Blastocatellia bacterium]|jgi:phospholipase/carboxylesterase|nr:dienelactone hydrolase family protein [Blastocatellia bacterium]